MSGFHYRKSSYSNASYECVEVAVNVSGMVAVRDSKHPKQPPVRCTPTVWSAFVSTLALARKA